MQEIKILEIKELFSVKEQRIRIISISIVFILLQILLAACSTPAQTASHQAGGSASGNGGGINAAQISLAPDKRKKQSVVIKIGLNLPLSGADASLGISAEDGALLALNQAKIPGYTGLTQTDFLGGNALHTISLAVSCWIDARQVAWLSP